MVHDRIHIVLNHACEALHRPCVLAQTGHDNVATQALQRNVVLPRRLLVSTHAAHHEGMDDLEFVLIEHRHVLPRHRQHHNTFMTCRPYPT